MGVYGINQGDLALNSGNYDLSYQGNNLTITKALLILLAPSWGGMINGMMTLSGAWHKLRSDPILRFLVVSLAFYGMSTAA